MRIAALAFIIYVLGSLFNFELSIAQERSSPPTPHALQLLDSSNLCFEHGFVRNKELQYYTRESVSFSNEMLVIEALAKDGKNAFYDPESQDWRAATEHYKYVSGSVYLCRPFENGRIEIEAKLPTSTGVWPAIWLFTTDRGSYGEIDAIEIFGGKEKAKSAIHFGDTWNKRTVVSSTFPDLNFSNRYVIFTIDRSNTLIRVSANGQSIMSIESAAGLHHSLRRPMFLKFNLAVGDLAGAPIDSVFPAKMFVKSIKFTEAK